MGHHLTDSGNFKSDLYAWCPEGFFALDFTRPKARIAIKVYAALTSEAELRDDLLAVCRNAEATEAHLDATSRSPTVPYQEKGCERAGENPPPPPAMYRPDPPPPPPIEDFSERHQRSTPSGR